MSSPDRIRPTGLNPPTGEVLPADQRRKLPGRDPAALGALFDAYFERVYAYVRGMVRQEHLSEDLTQDIFLQIYRAIEGYDPDRELDPWVFTIAVNRVRDHWRSRRHREAQSEASIDGDDENMPLVSTNEGPLDPLLRLENAQELRAAVGRLPASMRETILLRVFEGLPFDAIGRLLGRNEVAVRKRYSRGLEELRRSLTQGESMPEEAAT